VPGSMRIAPTGEIDGNPAVEIWAARNEVESSQIVITAAGGNLERIEYGVSSLQSEEQGEIPQESLTLYREVFVPVRHSSPRAAQPPGWYADPLVPWKNPYTGEEIRSPRWVDNKLEGGRFGATGFDLWENHHEALWLDIRIPKDARAGEYKGFLSVRARNAAEARIPIRVTVWDFTLPDGPTHENHFGGFSYVARYYDLDRNSDRYHLLEDRYIEMMAAHRLNPPLPQRLHPERSESGAIEVTEEFDRDLTAFVNRYAVTNIEIPRAPYSDVTGEDREESVQYYRSWYAYLKEKGWGKGAYLYMLDEPNDAEAYERVRQLGAVVREADAGIRRLVVEQPYTQNPDWGSLDDAIDIWCPLFGFIHGPSIQEKQDQGDEVWSYSALVQSAPRYHPEYEQVKNDNPPYWQIDFPVLSYRIAPWLNRRYGITGLLYWSTVYWQSPRRNPWDDPGFRIRFNGDGFLFYPGDGERIEGPVASIRLKNLRDGMEDYEYFAVLEELGGKDAVDAIVRRAVPTWGTWNQNPMDLLELRRDLAEEIVKKKRGL
ncbi:MAG: glycoside hydrolase domain-containing protein, partial [Candidatus Hinthialibacter sp.]